MSQIGTLEVVVIAFSGAGLSGRAANVLRIGDVTGDVRIVDALMVVKGADGGVRTEELSVTAAMSRVASEYGLTGPGPVQDDKRSGPQGADEYAGMLDATDIEEIGAILAGPGMALALLVEQVWARETTEAV